MIYDVCIREFVEKERNVVRTLGVITARSGSKGIKDKNIRYLNGKPLIAYTIESAIRSKYIDEVMVSTDSKAYADLSRMWGANVPFLRSEKNALDNAKSMDVLLEVLSQYERMGQEFDKVVLLQPTSPLRTYKNIDEAMELFVEKKADSVVSVCECEHSPLLCNVLSENLSMSEFITKENNVIRQEMKRYYRLNGAIYISKVETLRNIKSFYGQYAYAYIMMQSESVDIDTELDFEYAEFLMKRVRKETQ